MSNETGRNLEQSAGPSLEESLLKLGKTTTVEVIRAVKTDRTKGDPEREEAKEAVIGKLTQILEQQSEKNPDQY